MLKPALKLINFSRPVPLDFTIHCQDGWVIYDAFRNVEFVPKMYLLVVIWNHCPMLANVQLEWQQINASHIKKKKKIFAGMRTLDSSPPSPCFESDTRPPWQ